MYNQNNIYKAEEEKKRMSKKVFVVLAALAMTVSLVACAPTITPFEDVETPEFDFDVDDYVGINEEPTDEDRTAYDEFLYSHNIYRVSQMFLGLDSAAYAGEQNFCVSIHEFGYQDDIVVEWVNTIYIPLENLSDEQALRAEYQEEDSLSFGEVTFDKTGTHFVVTIHFKDLNNLDNCMKLYEMGWNTGSKYIGMNSTEQSLLGQGFIKR